MCRSERIVRSMCDRVVSQHLRAVCPTALRVCRKFEIAEGPFRQVDVIGSDLTDATVTLCIDFSTFFSASELHGGTTSVYCVVEKHLDEPVHLDSVSVPSKFSPRVNEKDVGSNS